LVGKNDWPKYVEEEPDIYEKDELRKLFAACDPEEKLWFEFFLKTGVREQEAQHTYWTDINFAAGTVRVTHKPDRGWTPKQYKERSMPLDPKLAEALKAWRTKNADKNCNLLFPTSGCKPKLDFLDCLKAVAKRAGLDPADCWLHKFRATFATTCLRGGLDLATVQKYMGHSDLASTMRYLKPAGDAESQAKFGKLFA
jgi:integrase